MATLTRAQPSHLPSIRVRIIATTLAVVALGWASWWGSRHVMWWTGTGNQIAAVVRAAAGVNENMLTPPQARHNLPMTRSEMAMFSRVTQQKLAWYYTGHALVGWRQIARQVLAPGRLSAAGKNSNWMTWWRVDWVHLGELDTLPGSTDATATATVEYRSNGGVVNRGDYTWHLIKTPAGWRIDSERFAYVPGYGP